VNGGRSEGNEDRIKPQYKGSKIQEQSKGFAKGIPFKNFGLITKVFEYLKIAY